MYLSNGIIIDKDEIKERYGSVKKFLNSLVGTRDFTAEIFINSKSLLQSPVPVTFSLNSGYVMGNIDARFALEEPWYFNNIRIVVSDGYGREVIESSTGKLITGIPANDVDADLWFKVGSVFPYNELKYETPESTFNSLNTESMIKIKLPTITDESEDTNQDPEEQDDITNDFMFVDLGLPSGTLWCTKNLGAENPEDAGKYYSLGEPYYKDVFPSRGYLRIADHIKYSINDVSGMNPVTYGPIPEQCSTWIKTDDYSEENWKDKATLDEVTAKNVFDISDNSGTVKDEYDSAYVVTGGDSVLPTTEQLHELINNTNLSVETIGDSKCIRFTSLSNAERSIVIPLAGTINGTSKLVDGCGKYQDAVGCGLMAKNGFIPDNGNKIACQYVSVYVNNSDNSIGSEDCTFDYATVGMSVRPVKLHD